MPTDPIILRAGEGDDVRLGRIILHGRSVDDRFSLIDMPTRWLTMFSPAGTEGYFAERAHLAGTTPADVEQDYAGLEPAAHHALRERYGIEVLGRRR